MARFIKIKKESIGMSPDSVAFDGDIKTDKITTQLLGYNAERQIETDDPDLSSLGDIFSTNVTYWLNVNGLHNRTTLNTIQQCFQIDTLLISDTMETHSRPRIYEYDDCVFLSLKMLQYNEIANYIDTENFVIIAKKNILVSFQEKPGDVFNPIRERIRKQKKRIITSGGDYLIFSLLDVIIDNYTYVISQIGEKIELLEEEIISDHTTVSIEALNGYKKEINYMLKTIRPVREIILQLPKLETGFIRKKTHVHFSELKDNLNLAFETAESYNAMLSDMLNMHNTHLNNRLNDIIKFLTIFSVIFIPLTFIAGIYGTNFNYVPELQFKYGYFYMLIIMLLIALIMVIYFKRKKWL